MARVLVVQHTAHEGLGRLQEWLPESGVDVHPIHPYLGHRVPPSVEGDALIVLGGPMGAMDDEQAPWLPAVRALLATAVDDGVPTLGYGEVDVTEADELLTLGTLPVVQWHYDTVTRLPDEALLMATNDRYAV